MDYEILPCECRLFPSSPLLQLKRQNKISWKVIKDEAGITVYFVLLGLFLLSRRKNLKNCIHCAIKQQKSDKTHREWRKFARKTPHLVCIEVNFKKDVKLRDKGHRAIDDSKVIYCNKIISRRSLSHFHLVRFES
jgi:hypothetical protein